MPLDARNFSLTRLKFLEVLEGKNYPGLRSYVCVPVGNVITPHPEMACCDFIFGRARERCSER